MMRSEKKNRCHLGKRENASPVQPKGEKSKKQWNQCQTTKIHLVSKTIHDDAPQHGGQGRQTKKEVERTNSTKKKRSKKKCKKEKANVLTGSVEQEGVKKNLDAVGESVLCEQYREKNNQVLTVNPNAKGSKEENMK